MKTERRQKSSADESEDEESKTSLLPRTSHLLLSALRLL